MEGYRIYFDKEEMKFKADDFKTEVGDYAQDGTTAWFNNFKAACNQVNLRNENILHEIKICKDCGTPYWLTKDRELWFLNKGMKLPVRCQSCIDKRKQHK